jgi:hypothetical protein
MRFEKRIQNLEKDLLQKKEMPAIAMKYLDGNIDWAGRIFPNEKEFHTAVVRAFKDEAPSPGPDVIVINFRRKMKNISQSK